jgi:hypothetical protein
LPEDDENVYAKNATFNTRSLSDIVNEFRVVRESSIILLKSFDENVFSQRGTANNKEISVRALAFLTAGHELHHLNVIKTKYLN